jgi:acid phosphatase family membrane protein YuiD
MGILVIYVDKLRIVVPILQIQQRSMMDKLGHNPMAVLVGMISVYAVSYILMRLLNDGFRETVIFKLPKKEKCYLY